MTTDAINQLVAEYNQAEAAQHERRLQLFRLLLARKGYRAVKFSGVIGGWSNCWAIEAERLWRPAHIDRMNQSILEVTPGAE